MFGHGSATLPKSMFQLNVYICSQSVPLFYFSLVHTFWRLVDGLLHVDYSGCCATTTIQRLLCGWCFGADIFFAYRVLGRVLDPLPIFFIRAFSGRNVGYMLVLV